MPWAFYHITLDETNEPDFIGASSAEWVCSRSISEGHCVVLAPEVPSVMALNELEELVETPVPYMTVAEVQAELNETYDLTFEDLCRGGGLLE